jgi:hypothetical protein
LDLWGRRLGERGSNKVMLAVSNGLAGLSRLSNVDSLDDLGQRREHWFRRRTLFDLSLRVSVDRQSSEPENRARIIG